MKQIFQILFEWNFFSFLCVRCIYHKVRWGIWLYIKCTVTFLFIFFLAKTKSSHVYSEDVILLNSIPISTDFFLFFYWILLWRVAHWHTLYQILSHFKKWIWCGDGIITATFSICLMDTFIFYQFLLKLNKHVEYMRAKSAIYKYLDTRELIIWAKVSQSEQYLYICRTNQSPLWRPKTCHPQ